MFVKSFWNHIPAFHYLNFQIFFNVEKIIKESEVASCRSDIWGIAILALF